MNNEMDFLREIEMLKRDVERLKTQELGGGVTDISVKVHHNSDQSISNASTTTLDFDDEDFDTDTMHDTVTNNSRLTCKTAGKFCIMAHVQFNNNDVTDDRAITILLNGTTVIASSQVDAAPGLKTSINAMTIYDLSVNDYIEVQVYQNSGSSIVIESTAESSPYFMMWKIN